METMTIVCRCGRSLQLRSESAGQQMRCPVCSHTFVVPQDWTAVAALPSTPPDKESPAETYRVVEDVEVVELAESDPPATPHPARPKKRGARRIRRRHPQDTLSPVRQVLIWIAWLVGHPVPFVGCFAITGIGVVLVLLSFKELVLASVGSSTPQQLTLAQLAAKGPGNNAHVVVTDFVVANNYVYVVRTSRMDRLAERTNYSRRRWEGVYVPLLPRSGGGGKARPTASPGSIRVLLYCPHIHRLQEVDKLYQKTRVKGMVVNSVRSLGSKTQKRLEESYPGADFSRCYILQEGRAPGNEGISLIFIVIGTLLFVTGALLLLIHFVFRGEV